MKLPDFPWFFGNFQIPWLFSVFQVAGQPCLKDFQAIFEKWNLNKKVILAKTSIVKIATASLKVRLLNRDVKYASDFHNS